MSFRHILRGFLRSGLLGAAILAPALAAMPLLAFPAQGQGASVARPSSASIRTPDFDEAVRWYVDNLGFRHLATRTLARERVALLERDGFLLEIAEADHPMPALLQPDPETTAAATRYAVISLLVRDVDGEVERLRARGVEILEEPRDDLEGEYRVAQIRDSGRHRIELREPIGFNPAGR